MKIKGRKVKRNLGVSTVVATMLMITITMGLAAIVVAWVGTTYGYFASGAEQYFILRQPAMAEQFTIENVFFTKSTGYIDIFVRNVGATLVKVVAVYVNGIQETPNQGGPNGASACTIPSGGLVLGTVAASSGVTACNQKPNMADFSVQIATGSNSNCPSQPWCSGDLFNIVVASGIGNQASYTAGAP
jgi:hypothetical protein